MANYYKLHLKCGIMAVGYRLSPDSWCIIRQNGLHTVDNDDIVNSEPIELETRPSMSIGEIYMKYRAGDSITDKELDFAINVLCPVVDVLSELGERFSHARIDLHHCLSILRDYKESRKRC